MTEQETNAAVEAHLEQVEQSCLPANHDGEVMAALENGFDVIALVSREEMTAGIVIATSAIAGLGATIAKNYNADTGQSVVFIPAGLDGQVTWHVTNWPNK